MVDITKAIREVDKNHIIIIEGNGWGNNYDGILPTWDDNMVLSFHKYWNYNDVNSIQKFLNYRDQYSVPIWLGETGENSNVWFTEAIRLMEKNNIGWAWWPLKKIGINNPLEIRSNHNYENLLKFWNGKSERAPKESDVYSGLLELATYTNLQANIIHHDVIDAMIRQPADKVAKPFKAHKVKNGTVIEAVDYDLGVSGQAYFDKDSANYRISSPKANNEGNRGRQYRNDGVDIEKDSSRFEKYYVNSFEEGEWLQYTLTAERAGKYTLALSIAADNDSGRVSIECGGKTVAKDLLIPSTGGTKQWQDITVKEIKLEAGKQTLKILAQKGGFNFRWMRFVQ